MVAATYGTLIAWARYDSLPAAIWTVASAAAVGVTLLGLYRLFPEVLAEQNRLEAERDLMRLEERFEDFSPKQPKIAIKAARARLRQAEEKERALRK